jgi:hypothetical protein
VGEKVVTCEDVLQRKRTLNAPAAVGEMPRPAATRGFVPGAASPLRGVGMGWNGGPGSVAVNGRKGRRDS